MRGGGGAAPVRGGGPWARGGGGGVVGGGFRQGGRVPESVRGPVAGERREILGEPGSGRVDMRGGALQPDRGVVLFLGDEGAEGGGGRLRGKDRGWSRLEAVGAPSLKLVPKRGQPTGHASVGSI